MHRKLFLFLLLSTLYCLLSIPAFAAVPNYINYQGKLTQSDGTPLPVGTQSLTFKIYSGGSYWEETKDVLLDDQGQFTTVLGDDTVLANIDFSKQITLEVTINAPGGSQSFVPKQSIFTVPYAFYAATAETVMGPTIYEKGGQVGIGTTTPAAKLDVAGNISVESGNSYFGGNVGIGTPTPTATLEVKGTVKMFGEWSNDLGTTLGSDPYYVTGHATSDGFICAIIAGTSSSGTNYGGIFGYTDNSSNPTTLRSSAHFSKYDQVGYTVYDYQSSFTMPVKKGHYWKVTWDRTNSTGNMTFTVYWIPLGQ